MEIQPDDNSWPQACWIPSNYTIYHFNVFSSWTCRFIPLVGCFSQFMTLCRWIWGNEGVGGRSGCKKRVWLKLIRYMKWNQVLQRCYETSDRIYLKISTITPLPRHTHTQSVNDMVLREFSPLLDVSIAQSIFSSGIIWCPVSFPEVSILSISSI